MDFSGILFPLQLKRNRIYTAPAAQGLPFMNSFMNVHEYCKSMNVHESIYESSLTFFLDEH